MVLLVHENGTHTDILEEPIEQGEIEEGEMIEVAEISVNSVVGISFPHMIKLKGKISSVEVVVLIDSGASDIFIFESLVRRLGLKRGVSRGYGVMVGVGMIVRDKGICEEVKLILPTCVVTSQFLPIELGIADISVGVQWLGTLGETRDN